MKVTVIHTIVVGKGDKAQSVLPGPAVVDTRKLGLSDDDAKSLIKAGHLESAERSEAAQAVAPSTGQPGGAVQAAAGDPTGDNGSPAGDWQ